MLQTWPRFALNERKPAPFKVKYPTAIEQGSIFGKFSDRCSTGSMQSRGQPTLLLQSVRIRVQSFWFYADACDGNTAYCILSRLEANIQNMGMHPMGASS
jgi:hypothetical protein